MCGFLNKLLQKYLLRCLYAKSNKSSVTIKNNQISDTRIFVQSHFAIAKIINGSLIRIVSSLKKFKVNDR